MIDPLVVALAGYAQGIADQRTNGQVSTTYPTSFKSLLECDIVATHAEVSGSLVFDLQPSGVRVHEHAAQVLDFLCKRRVRASRVEECIQSLLGEIKVGLTQFVLIP